MDTKYPGANLLQSPQIRCLVCCIVPIAIVWGGAVALYEFEWLLALTALSVVVVPLCLAARTTTMVMAQRWALDRGVAFDARVIPQLHRHLVRTRLARTLGVTAFFGVNVMLVAHYNASPEQFRWYIDEWNGRWDGLWLAGLGYVIGTVWAELRKPRDATGSSGGAAVLAPARFRDFADGALLWMLGPMGLSVLVAIAVAALAGTPSARVIRAGDLWGGTAVTILATLAAMLICRRSQRSADSAAVAYEELTRSATVNALLGSAIAMLGLVVSALFGSAQSNPSLSRWFIVPPMLFFGWVPIAIWFAAGTKFVFRSRRMDALRSGPRVAR